jgi:hypothetical protein
MAALVTGLKSGLCIGYRVPPYKVSGINIF